MIERRGNKHSKVKVIAIHGGPGMDYSYFIPYLSILEKEFEIFYYTQGHSGHYSIEGLVHELRDIIEASSAQDHKIFLLAHSFGASLVLESLRSQATYYEEKIQGIIFSNWIYDYDWVQYLDWKTINNQCASIDKALSEDEVYREEMLRLGELYFTPKYLKQGDEVLKKVKFNASLKNIINEQFLSTFNAKDTLLKLSLPILSLIGDKDRIVHAQYFQRELVTLLGSIQHEVISNAGHFPFIENESLFCNRVISFINKMMTRI